MSAVRVISLKFRREVGQGRENLCGFLETGKTVWLKNRQKPVRTRVFEPGIVFPGGVFVALGLNNGAEDATMLGFLVTANLVYSGAVKILFALK